MAIDVIFACDSHRLVAGVRTSTRLSRVVVTITDGEQRILDDPCAAESELESADPTDGERTQTLLDRARDSAGRRRGREVVDLVGLTDEGGRSESARARR